ncbi:MAG: sodium:solute symporter family protein [Oscillospiraceae bacterium]|nr:sodium:solute symporter family protein [Oscillospiraceae bacterium]
MNGLLYFGWAVTLLIIVSLSIWSGTRAKKDKRNPMPVVAGVITGTLVGGSSTIGTAQLAYQFGMSAWWYTLGAGISCLILALVYAKPLRRTGGSTLVGIIRSEYGSKVGMAVSVLSSVGTFINVIPQVISATAVLAVIFPAMSLATAVIISVVFMILYVIFGGTKGAGIVGIVKMILIYITMIVSAVMVLGMVGGLPAFVSMAGNIPDPDGIRFTYLFSRGVGTDIGACLSVLLGVITTQTYAQGVLSGRTDKDGVGGALISAFLIPPIGIGGILVGLYMRANAALYAGVTAKTALTAFITAHLPPLPAGIILGTLFITVVGTGAGITLGISTMLTNDIWGQLIPRFRQPKAKAVLSKLMIALVLAVAGFLACGSLGDIILQFTFMSMGLRGAVVFLPLSCALWLPGKISTRYAMASVITGPLVVLLFGLWKVLPFDPLFAGVGASLLIMAAGLHHHRKLHT